MRRAAIGFKGLALAPVTENSLTSYAASAGEALPYAGSMSRSFYVGESLTEQDIHAKYENGILTLDVPKEDKKAVPEKRYIAIEG